MMEGRSFAVPEDVQAVLPGVAGHRLKFSAAGDGSDPVEDLLKSVPVP